MKIKDKEYDEEMVITDEPVKPDKIIISEKQTKKSDDWIWLLLIAVVLVGIAIYKNMNDD